MSMPAGWYDDGSGRQRWWDGARWTEQFAPDAGSVVLPAPAPVARVAPVLGFVGLALAVLGTILACIPATFVVGVVVLLAGFVVSLIGVFKKNAVKWPSIVGMILSIVGGAIGTVVTLVIVAASLAGPIVPATPTGVPSSPTSEQPSESPAPSVPPTGGADEGRPSPEVIADLLGQQIRDGGTTAYDDMPEFFPCMGRELYESDIDDQTLWLLIRGAESLGVGQDAAEQTTADAIWTCDPNGEGAWG